jgi:hypothetical protein
MATLQASVTVVRYIPGAVTIKASSVPKVGLVQEPGTYHAVWNYCTGGMYVVLPVELTILLP